MVPSDCLHGHSKKRVCKMCELKKDHVDPRCAWCIWTWPRLKDLITVYTTSSPLHRNEKVNIYHSLWGNPIIQHFGDGEVNSCFLFFLMLCWICNCNICPDVYFLWFFLCLIETSPADRCSHIKSSEITFHEEILLRHNNLFWRRNHEYLFS